MRLTGQKVAMYMKKGEYFCLETLSSSGVCCLVPDQICAFGKERSKKNAPIGEQKTVTYMHLGVVFMEQEHVILCFEKLT